MKRWNFFFDFFFKVADFFFPAKAQWLIFSLFSAQKCLKIFFFSVKKPSFFVPKLGLFVPQRERFFLSCGGKDFFCPTDKKTHSLLRTKKIFPSFGQKKIFPSFGTKKPNFGTKKTWFLPEKKKILKHFWKKNWKKVKKKLLTLKKNEKEKFQLFNFSLRLSHF